MQNQGMKWNDDMPADRDLVSISTTKMREMGIKSSEI